MAGIYIHIPFCQKKCLYCDFYSVVSAREMYGFVAALKVEAMQRAYELDGVPIETIYLGGGTPSMLSTKLVGEILEVLRANYEVCPDAEITMECNPGDVSQMEIEQLMHFGINRFSIGAQSFQDNLLKQLGRRHKAVETIELYEDMRAAGATNISMDLIYSIPGEDLPQLEEDLQQLIALSPEHISTYDLIYEPNTPLYQMRETGAIREVAEECSIEMAHRVREVLGNNGYEHYEISNFARPSYKSRHNSNYWNSTPYIGLGPSAHSYLPPWRSWNEPSVTHYADQLLNGAEFLTRTYEEINLEMAREEYLLTRLRTSDGISISEMRQSGFSIPLKAIEEMEQVGYIKLKNGRYSLSDKGLDFADSILLALASD